MTYYNENDPKAAAWLRALISQNLIAPGEVDERSIEDVRADDLTPFIQCHFFAGIGGWSYALRLAGWPDSQPVWTGSCPCQPFSVAGRGLGTADKRHLWPHFHLLIAERKPPTVFGEQVASKAGREWLSGIRTDLEVLGYAVGAADLCAASVGHPHNRQRLFFVANSAEYGFKRLQRQIAPQISKNRPPQALGAWNSPGNPFFNWREQLAETRIDRMDDGFSSGMVVRPALRGYGNAIVPQVAQAFIEAYLETRGEGRAGEPACQSDNQLTDL